MPKQTGRIILVDDEEIILEPLKDQLEDAGFKVDAYLDAVPALAAFPTSGEKVDLILTDMSMPGMDGIQFAKKVRELSPDIPVLVMSGFLPDVDPIPDSGKTVFLLKPFTFETLMDQINQLL